jgi:hypothetical protein
VSAGNGQRLVCASAHIVANHGEFPLRSL